MLVASVTWFIEMGRTGHNAGSCGAISRVPRGALHKKVNTRTLGRPYYPPECCLVVVRCGACSVMGPLMGAPNVAWQF